MTTPTTPTCRCLTGSTAGRGPCEACGAIAELHLAEEWRRRTKYIVRNDADPLLAICLPCAERSDLARAA